MMNSIKKNYLIFIFLSLIIPSLISGPFLPDLIVSLSSLFFLIYIFKTKKFHYFFNKPLIFFFIFCLYILLVSIFVAEDILLSFDSSLFYFRIGIFSCLIYFLIERDKTILNYFYFALVLSFLVLILDGYLQYFTGENILGYPKQENYRISSFFDEELIMGSYLSRLLPLLYALFFMRQKTFYEVCFMIIFFLLANILVIISGERSAAFFIILSNLFILILMTKYLRARITLLLIGCALVAALLISDEKLRHRLLIKPAITMGFIEDSGPKYIFTPQHDSLIRTAYNMFKDKPLFGHGPKMYRIKCKEKKYATGITPCMTHPHNFYVQLLAETGIIGFSFLLSVFLYIIYCIYKQLSSFILKKKSYLNNYQVCLLGAILITVWPFSPNGNFFHNWLMVCYSLPIGFYLHSIYGKNK